MFAVELKPPPRPRDRARGAERAPRRDACREEPRLRRRRRARSRGGRRGTAAPARARFAPRSSRAAASPSADAAQLRRQGQQESAPRRAARRALRARRRARSASSRTTCSTRRPRRPRPSCLEPGARLPAARDRRARAGERRQVVPQLAGRLRLQPAEAEVASSSGRSVLATETALSARGGRLEPRWTSARSRLAPVVSEKSYSLIDENRYSFRVHKDAHRLQVRQAVEELFGVKVLP